MAISSFLNVNGYDLPCPHVGFNYIISTTVNAGRNANNAVIGQRVGRDLYKFDTLEWVGLKPDVWAMILAAVEPFYVPVTFEDIRRPGTPITITMYHGDISAKPLFVNPDTNLVEQYEVCKVNLIRDGDALCKKQVRLIGNQ